MPADALFFSLIAATVSAVALSVIALFGPGVRQASRALSIAAGGMLLTMVLFHIAPKAIETSSLAWMFMALGGLIGLGLQTMLSSIEAARFPTMVGRDRTVPASETARNQTAGTGAAGVLAIAPLLAIALHSLFDGAIYGLAFTGGDQSGVYAVAALIIHEVPEAFVAFVLASGAGLSFRRAVIAAFLAASVTTPFGAWISAPLLSAVGEAMLPNLFAVSAGLLAYVALGPLLSPLYNPPSHRAPTGLRSLGAGAAAAGLMLVAPVPHLHDHSHGSKALDGDGSPVHAQVHDHADGEDHHHPNFAPF